jgi:hypothetical protein
MAFSERSVRALLGGLAIVGCKAAAAPNASTSSVVVGDAGASAELVVVPPKDSGDAVVESLSLRRVDWANQDYGGWVGRLRDGRNMMDVADLGGGAHGRVETTFVSVAFGDLDSDGREEAAILLKQEIWRLPSGRRDVDAHLAVFAWRDGVPTYVASVSFLRATASVHIAGGKVVVDEPVDGPPCLRRMTLEGDHLLSDRPMCPR